MANPTPGQSVDLAVPRGHGLVRVAHNLRVNVPARQWQETIGTDYWLMAGSADLVTASGATNISGLDSYGWTTTSILYANLVTADFMSSADDTLPIFSANAQNDLLRSPIIFGNYSHALAVAEILGYVPNVLRARFYGAFIVASGQEATSYMGFDNGAAAVAAVYSDGTASTFLLTNGVTTLAGPAIDTAYHLWDISIDHRTSLITLNIDGVSYGTLALTQDVWPVAFAATAAGASNHFAVAWAHVRYE